jgi:trigger factor
MRTRRYLFHWDMAAPYVRGAFVRQPTPSGVQQLLKMSPMAQVLAGKPPALPVVAAPSLEGLAVTVPAPADLTQDDLLERFHEKARALAVKLERKAGEALAMGDDAQVDVLGYVDGKLLAFSARFGAWMELAPLPALPGLTEGIAKGKVGDSLQVSLTLPADYPVPALRGKPVRFIVDVRAARQVTMPDTESAVFFAKLGLGTDLDAVMDAVREELEQELADELWVDAERLVLDELVARAKVQVPKALLDDEIRRRWADAEGRALVEKGFTVDEQNEALKVWLDDVPTRAECERRIAVGLVLRAIAERDQLTLSKEQLEQTVLAWAKPFGFGPADVQAALRESKEQTAKLYETAWHLMAVEHVLDAAKVTFEGA